MTARSPSQRSRNVAHSKRGRSCPTPPNHPMPPPRQNLDAMLGGHLDPVIDALRTYFQAESLRGDST